jgi:2-polyprenyl-3-methyl-5-hydroxy-6-metoxy-1,4-benzoquinol methylase
MIRKDLLRPCPVCQCATGDILHVQKYAQLDEGDLNLTVDIVACSVCGMVFNDLRSGQNELDQEYEEASKYADMSIYAEEDTQEDSLEAPFDLERLQGTVEWLNEAFIRRDMRVLDAGCATGSLLGYLKESGWSHLVGLDPSPVATMRAKKTHGVDARSGSFIYPPEGIGQFELVVLSHVLEHLLEVRQALDSMVKLTKQGGYVYLEVPDAERYADFLIAPVHDFNSEHINHFSARQLMEMMKNAGFEFVSGGKKVVEIAPSRSYPAMFGLWRLTADEMSIGDSAGFEYDSGLVLSIQRYIENSNTLLERIDDSLTRDLSEENEVALWGAGNLLIKLLKESILSEKKIVAIIDNSPQRQGRNLDGIPIVSPDDFRNDSVPIVVTSLHHDKAIIKSIKETLSLPNRVVTLLPN